jgi:hypothetical protein
VKVRQLPPIFAALLALGAPAHSALAWGPEGHRLTGEIADRYLSPQTRSRVGELLRDDRLSDGRRSGRRTLGEVANWADEIRDTERGRKLSPMHFDDMPLCGRVEYSKYCRRGRCATAYLTRQLGILSDPSSSPPQRNQALKWVVHLVGDIHQPLHAAGRDDRGGNAVEVAFFGERGADGRLNLHAVWDFHLLRRWLAERGGENAVLSEPASARELASWQQGSPSDWIRESHDIARDLVYPALPVPDSCTQPITGVVAIDEAYFARAAPVAVSQVRKAGVRLARLLNETLGQ